MQTTHHCNGEGLPDYPQDVKAVDVNVWMHDSGMLSTHDYSCPVCRYDHAVLDHSTGLMQPCWKCQGKGYRLIKAADKKQSTRDMLTKLAIIAALGIATTIFLLQENT